jgi:anti-sigma factor RsiW
MNPSGETAPCPEIAPLLVFYVCDELTAQERTVVEKHLAACDECRKQLFEEREFHGILSDQPSAGDWLDPSSLLLSQCRSELAEKIDDLARPRATERALGLGWMRRWMVLHPAWSAATLVLLGLVVGMQSTQWFSLSSDITAVEPVNVRPSPRFTEDQLAKMEVAGINFTPAAGSGSQNVRVQMSAEEPVELSGSLDDSDVRSVLTYVVKNGERFDSGLRLDCLDALKARAADRQVRTAFLTAARKDQNPAVRLKALEALRDSVPDGDVRETLLDALKHDSNPGVRVEAVNLLVRSLDNQSVEILTISEPDSAMVQVGHLPPSAASPFPADESLRNVIHTLEDLQSSDPSRYVRLRSAAALREINARNEQ